MWTIQEAQPLLGRMNALALHCNFFLGLAGSVLNDGYSSKDLDIICLPRSKKFAIRENLLAEMIGILQSELGVFNISQELLNNEDYFEIEMEGRIVWKMEFAIGNPAGIHVVKRIDWIFVDY